LAWRAGSGWALLVVGLLCSTEVVGVEDGCQTPD